MDRFKWKAFNALRENQNNTNELTRSGAREWPDTDRGWDTDWSDSTDCSLTDEYLMYSLSAPCLMYCRCSMESADCLLGRLATNRRSIDPRETRFDSVEVCDGVSSTIHCRSHRWSVDCDQDRVRSDEDDRRSSDVHRVVRILERENPDRWRSIENDHWLVGRWFSAMNYSKRSYLVPIVVLSVRKSVRRVSRSIEVYWRRTRCSWSVDRSRSHPTNCSDWIEESVQLKTSSLNECNESMSTSGTLIALFAEERGLTLACMIEPMIVA